MSQSGYRPQLDSLRALAALSVFYSHFWIEESYAGALGVRVFFVLSGYLITGILLDISDRASGSGAKWRGLRSFYVRRALRIWSAFYGVLFLGLALNVQDIRDSGWWHALFASNVYFTYHGWAPPFAVSWWTLAVEEQFYLAWPCLVLFVPRRHLAPLLCAFVAISYLQHFTLDVLALPLWWRSALMPIAQLDVLSCGGLLALAERHHNRFPAWIGPLALVSVMASVVLLVTDNLDWTIIATTPFLVGAVALCARGLMGLPGRVLESRLLRSLGQISYGGYIIHLAIAPLAVRLTGLVGVELGRGPLLFAVGTPMTFALAAIMWRYF